MLTHVQQLPPNSKRSRSGEQGWALLGLILALGVMSIVLVSAVVPNVQMQVQRDKEAEMVYRGEQMAMGIARYYGRGNLIPLQVPLLLTPIFGPLELKKLSEGATLGAREIRFVRPSALIEPMYSSEWEPVRLRDPRIMRFLQAWATENSGANLNLPPYSAYLTIAGPPLKSVFTDSSSDTPTPPPGGPAPGGSGQPGQPGQPIPPGAPGAPGAIGAPGVRSPSPPGSGAPGNVLDDPNDNDPFAHLFDPDAPGQGNIPIVGVAPTKKGQAIKPYFGLDRYEDWVFIYIPIPQGQRIPGSGGVLPQPPSPPVVRQ